MTIARDGTKNPTVTLRADYTRPWHAKGRVDVGLSLQRRTQDDNRAQQVFPAQGEPPTQDIRTLFTYRENFQSAYLTASQSYGKLSVTLGGRAGLAQTDFTVRTSRQRYDHDYRSLFPSLNLAWDAGRGRTLRFSCSKRISRPPSYYLNPDVPSVDPLNRTAGNPGLEPAYTRSFGLDFSKVGSRGTLRFAPFYRLTVNNFESIKVVDSLGVSTVTYANSASSRSAGASVLASLRPMGRVSGSVNLSLYRYVTNASNISPELQRSSTTWSLGGNAAARVTKTLNGQFFASYYPSRPLPQGRSTGYVFSQMGLRQQLLNNRATLNACIFDPLDLMRYRYETSDHTHIQTSRTTMKARAFTLSVTWNFGKPPQQNSRQGQTNSTDDTVRIR